MAGAALAVLFAVCVAMAVVPPTAPVMAAEDPSLENLNTGDMAWIMVASAIVLLMTPGVSFFYGGMVRHKNVVATLMQGIVTLAIIPMIWCFIGFSLSFGEDAGYPGFIGNPSTYGLFKNVGAAPVADFSATIPLALFAIFQMMFAVITPSIVVGAICERVNFSALCLFVILWHLIVYCPLAHMVWHPKGLIRSFGVIDFAGGTVVHMSSGWAALAAAWFLGPSAHAGEGVLEVKEPANVPIVILGTALLWMGWFGFNGGSALAAGPLAVQAFLTTNTAAASAMATWLLMDQLRGLKFRATGVCAGALVGLVGITPGSGFVTVGAAALIGIITAIICNLAQLLMEKYGRKYVDDTLDVFACHGVGGTVGQFLTGLFATTAVNSAGADGAFYGNPMLVGKDVLVLVVLIPWLIVATLLCLWLTNLVLELRAADDDQLMGLDVSKHGERAAAFDLDIYAGGSVYGSAYGSVHGVGWGNRTGNETTNGEAKVNGLLASPDVA